MAYGIGSILGDIDQKADAYRNNPDALAQSYQQNQQLIDLLVLQKLKTDKEAAQRDMQAKMQTPASTIKDQRAQEVMGMTRNEVAQQVTPGLQALSQQMQAAQAQPQAQGIASVPAPNMQQIGMKGGGIIAFQEGGTAPPAEDGMGIITDTPPGVVPAKKVITELPEDERAQIAKAVNTSFPTDTGISSLFAKPVEEDKTKAILSTPTEVVKRAPSAAQQSYTQQLADLRVEQESKLESLIAFLKGAGGQSSFAATMMGGSEGMNARDAQVKGEIADVLGKLEAIDLKEQEFGIDTERNDIAREANRLQFEASANQNASQERMNAAENRSQERIATQRNLIDIRQADAADRGVRVEELRQRVEASTAILLRASNLDEQGLKHLEFVAGALTEANTSLTLALESAGLPPNLISEYSDLVARNTADIAAISKRLGATLTPTPSPIGDTSEVDATTQAALDKYK